MEYFSFKAKSHILSLLGDELIGSDILAIFELIKNSYDAGATEVNVILNDLNTDDQQIIVEDNGSGMTLYDLKNNWLEIGTDFKRGEKRVKKFGRIPLGEKGVGRLAVHKLGECIKLETQTIYSTSFSRIFLNWRKLINESNYIEDTKVKIETIPGRLFENKYTSGTRITVSKLKKIKWSKKDLRDLARKVNSIISPFHQISDFNIYLSANDFHNDWFENVKDVNELIQTSLYYFEFKINPNSNHEFANFEWEYKFTPPANLTIKSFNKTNRNSRDKNKYLLNIQKDNPFKLGQMHLLNEDLIGIGSISGKFYVYNLLSEVLRSFGQINAIKEFVKENCGVRVFRDGIRVYNYGEPSDDWLGLDLARIQRLGDHFSKNTVIGAIDIELKESQWGLKEKTNREGFDDNIYYTRFKFICREVFDFFENSAQGNREEIKSYLKGVNPVKKVGLSETLIQLEEKLKEKRIDNELKPFIKRVEKDYNDMRDVMLSSGMSGLNLGIVFHEVERELKYINLDLEKNQDNKLIKERLKHLMSLLENFSPILKQNKLLSLKAQQVAEKAYLINQGRMKYHNIDFRSSLIDEGTNDFMLKGAANLFISTISNLFDNSIYWLRSKKEILGDTFHPKIFLGADLDNFSGPTIIFADNGDGFTLNPEDLVLPFRTTKPGGMGLGLYFANLVMEMGGGKLEFPEIEEIEIPAIYNGAIIALVFPKSQIT